MKHSKKCPQSTIGYVRLKNSSITEKVIMVNGPEVWTRPGCDGLTHGMDGIWLMDGCFPPFYLLTYFMQFEFSGKIPENFPDSIFPEKLQP